MDSCCRRAASSSLRSLDSSAAESPSAARSLRSNSSSAFLCDASVSRIAWADFFWSVARPSLVIFRSSSVFFSDAAAAVRLSACFCTSFCSASLLSSRPLMRSAAAASSCRNCALAASLPLDAAASRSSLAASSRRKLSISACAASSAAAFSVCPAVSVSSAACSFASASACADSIAFRSASRSPSMLFIFAASASKSACINRWRSEEGSD